MDESVTNNEEESKEIESPMATEMTTIEIIPLDKPPIIDELKERSVERNILRKIELTLNTVLKYFEDDDNNFEMPKTSSSTPPPPVDVTEL